jgi:hypothetical protein
LELQQAKSNNERFLDIKLFVTSIKNKDEVRKSALNALKDFTPFANQDLLKEKSLELLDRIQSGRPDLEKVSAKSFFISCI